MYSNVAILSFNLIYCNSNVCKFYLFYFFYYCHARDAYGKVHKAILRVPVCLLQVSSIQNVLQYFQGVHASGEVYELKGLHVLVYDINESV